MRRVAMISVHTSPLEQPGIGDAGGMNVYLVELAKRLAGRAIEVDVFTRATSSAQESVVDVAPGVRLHHVVAGPFEWLSKHELPGELCGFARGMLGTILRRSAGWYDVIHSHYWLSGKVGAMVGQRIGVPLVHTMHTMAKVKNALLAPVDRPEPPDRIVGEEETTEAAHRLIANTDAEARQLIDLYDAPPERVSIVHPGVDLDTFRPGRKGRARRRLGIPRDALVLTFAGRIQPLKAPDVLLRAAARLVSLRPDVRDRVLIPVIGGLSGQTMGPDGLAALSRELGIGDLVRFVPPRRRPELADWFRASTVVAVPSYNESFGLVALEAQACGTPVVAAATGGLPTAVRDDVSGVLVEGHDPDRWAGALEKLIDDPVRLRRLGAGAARHASGFGWEATADRTLEVYADAIAH